MRLMIDCKKLPIYHSLMRLFGWRLIFGFSISFMLPDIYAARDKADNVIIVTIDGLRWQEVFNGADPSLISADSTSGGIPKGLIFATRKDFITDRNEDKRKKLMAFVWGEMAQKGQIIGNRNIGSKCFVTNKAKVSYPGYNELLTGIPDPDIVTNKVIPNHNVTVLEWLNNKPYYTGKVTAAAAWNVFTAILNEKRSRLPLFVTGQHSNIGSVSKDILKLEQLMDEIPGISESENYDAFVYHAAIDQINTMQPKVMLIAFGEPDEWAHQRRYDQYLQSIKRCDMFIKKIWEHVQSIPQYRGRTTLIVTPDHGRGATHLDWTGHGVKIDRSEETWMVLLGVAIPPLGERTHFEDIHQAQIAATIAELLGEDYSADFPRAEKSILSVIKER